MPRRPKDRPTPWLLVAATFLLSLPAEAQMKVAVIDLQRAIWETEEGMKAQARFRKAFDKRQQELDAKQSELQRAREDIEKQSRVLSKEALAKRMDAWQKSMIELQTVFIEYNKELQKSQNELTAPIIKKVMGLLRRVATQRGYDVILDKTAAPYARGDLDLTDHVVQMYNKGETGDAPAEGTTEAPKDEAPRPTP